MKTKLIIADVDGCIAPEEAVSWDFTQFALLAAGVRGLNNLTLCTGRPQPYVELLAKLLDIQLPMICENGALLYSLKDNRTRYGPGVTLRKIQSLHKLRVFIEKQLLPSYPNLIMQFGKDTQVSLFCNELTSFTDIVANIKHYVAINDKPRVCVSNSHYCLNVSLEGVNKGNTLKLLLGELNFGKDDVVGIGDTEGDLPLRDAVGFFACPSNATDVIKDIADYISPYPTTKGMLDILTII